MTAQDVSLYYDELHRWSEKDKDFQTFSGFENNLIHCFLVDTETGAFSPDTIYKFIDPHIAALSSNSPRGLDAGCGYGGTCFHGLRVHGGHWTGITISEEQLAYANGIAKARGVADKIDFRLASYDDPPPDRYDVIVAIESLIHSSDPARTLTNLATALDRGGRMIIVDDMPLDPLPARDVAFFEEFKRLWRCPVAPSAERWIAFAAQSGLRLEDRKDLTELTKPRAEPDLDAALNDLGSQSARKAEQGFGRLSDAEIGGLHLERLLGRRTIRYVVLVFEKP